MPTPHYKPSKKEIQANIDAAAKALETPIDPPAPKDPIPPAIDPKDPATPPIDPTPTPDPIMPPAQDPAPVQETPEEKIAREADEAKKRAANSARESQRLLQEKKDLNKAVEEAAQLPIPTVEELKIEYPEWEDMTPTEQRLALDNLQNKRKIDAIHTATSKARQHDDWIDKIATWVSDPKVLIANPELEGKQTEFELFATQKERRGSDMQTLVLAFIGEQAKNKVIHKGKMFETGQGGGAAPVTKPNDGKISLSEGQILRTTDYKRYVEMLKDGKIR